MAFHESPIYFLCFQKSTKRIVRIFLWSQENVFRQPLKFCYAKFLSALNSFFHEKYETTLHSLLKRKNFLKSRMIATAWDLFSAPWRSIPHAR